MRNSYCQQVVNGLTSARQKMARASAIVIRPSFQELGYSSSSSCVASSPGLVFATCILFSFFASETSAGDSSCEPASVLPFSMDGRPSTDLLSDTKLACGGERRVSCSLLSCIVSIDLENLDRDKMGIRGMKDRKTK